MATACRECSPRRTSGWLYKRNVSAGTFAFQAAAASIRPVGVVAEVPSLPAEGQAQQFLDLAGDGQLDSVVFERPLGGLLRAHAETRTGNRFAPFASVPNVALGRPEPAVRRSDGDGHADVLITERQAFTWYPSLAEDGFGPAERVPGRADEETDRASSPPTTSRRVFLADM